MEDEDLALTITILATLYTFPVLYLTAKMVAECLASARDRDPQAWWVRHGCASLVVVLALSISLFLFYLVFVVPLAIYAFIQACRASAHTPPNETYLRGRGYAKSAGKRPDRRGLLSRQSETLLEGGRRRGDIYAEDDRPVTAPPTGRSKRNAMDLSFLESDRVRFDVNALDVEGGCPGVVGARDISPLESRFTLRSWMSEIAPRTGM